MELALTARTFKAEEARSLGLVSNVLPDTDSLNKAASQMAAELASKSPVAITGTKHLLLQQRQAPFK